MEDRINDGRQPDQTNRRELTYDIGPVKMRTCHQKGSFLRRSFRAPAVAAHGLKTPMIAEGGNFICAGTAMERKTYLSQKTSPPLCARGVKCTSGWPRQRWCGVQADALNGQARVIGTAMESVAPTERNGGFTCSHGRERTALCQKGCASATIATIAHVAKNRIFFSERQQKIGRTAFVRIAKLRGRVNAN